MREAIVETRAGKVAVGHPVDVASGSVFTVQHDFTYPGTVMLDWRRRYSTDSKYVGILGRGWTVPYLMRLTPVEGGFELFDEDGGRLHFAVRDGLREPGALVRSFGANMELRREADRFIVVHWHYGTDDVERFHFVGDGSGEMALAAVENLQGHRIELAFDDRGRLWRLWQQIEQRTIELVYNVDGLLEMAVFMKEDGGRKPIASYSYDEERRLVGFRDATGATTSYQYDSHHRMIAETNPLGSTFRFEYDGDGRCVYSSGDGGYMARRLQYFQAPRRTRVTDSLGHAIDFLFNAAGLVIQEIPSVSGPWTTEYDGFGRESVTIDPLGGSVRFDYDEYGNRSTIVDETGGVSRLQYDAQHVLLAYTDPMGATWTFERDAQSSVVAAVDPLGGRQQVLRNGQKLVRTTVSAAGRRIERRYGPALRWIDASDQLGLLGRLEYDEEGDQTAAYNTLGLVQHVRYDGCHRPIEVRDRLGGVYQTVYNEIGQPMERHGPDIGWERREYDQFGQLVRHVNPLGEMRFTYDTEGRMTEVLNRAGEQMRLRYDGLGRLIAQQQFDGRLEYCEYDACGKPKRQLLADGREVVLQYDAAGRMVGRESSDGLREVFTLDANGDITKAETPETVVELARDPTGRVVAEIQNGQRIDYSHDADGHRTARRIAGIADADLERRNDVRGRMTSLADSQGTCQTWQWDAVDRLVHRDFAGGSEQLAYDDAGRLWGQRVTVRGNATVQRVYRYDTMDNIHAIDEAGRGQIEFDYDPIGRLIGARTQRGAEHYRYDPNGSITETHHGTRQLQLGGRTLHDGERRYEYDANGCVSRISGLGLDLDLAYDVDGRLVTATSSSGMKARYTYDALGRRTRKDVDGIATNFLWEGFVLAAQGKNGQFDSTYYFHALDPVAQWDRGERKTPVTEQSGLVRELMDARGAVVGRAVSEAYGLVTEQTGERSPFRLRGQYFDAETGLHYNFHRTYDPHCANYLSPDPIGIEGGANSYFYPRNPLLWDDPYGLSCGRRSCKAEERMTKAMAARGYSRISVKGKNVMANGIDGIYHNPNGTPPYIIAEAKSGCAVLRWSGPKDTNGKGTIQQMSDAWINGRPGNSPDTRLAAALPPQANGQPSPHLTAIQTGSAGPVGREVYNPDRTPKTTTLPNYGGGTSTTKTV